MSLLLTNLTPKKLTITGEDASEIVLAPFERRELISDGELRYPLENLESRGLIAYKKTGREERVFSDVLTGAGTLTMALIIFLSVISKENPDLAIALGIGFLVVGLIALFFTFGIIRKGRAAFKGWLQQAVTMLIILVIGVGFPLYAYEGLNSILGLLRSGPETNDELNAILQLVFTIIVSLLPALLYFIFDRQLLGTLRDRFEQSIFRLDDSLETLRDVRAKYGRRIDEAFGSALDSGSQARLVPGTRAPIFVATAVITLGWIWVLMPDLLVTDKSQHYFSPRESALSYAFLGAYFFSIILVVRRYVRGDLKPKAYSSITVRILLASIGAWMLEVMFLDFSPGTVFVLAFVVGYFPETLLIMLQEKMQKLMVGKVDLGVTPKQPLSELDGIDLYDRARLLDEGIANIESLAHHDLIELMLDTRIPLTRLVDWVDQAILYLRLCSPTKSSSDGGKALRIKLRQSGIRTATDLERSFKLICDPDEEPLFDKQEQSHLELVILAMANDDWLASIQRWRSTVEAEVETQTV